jgi:DNA-binding NarL/FixJ family response regulator
VIADYALPDMTGAQLPQEIRAVEPSARVILFSGRAHLPAGELAYVDVRIVKGSLLDNIVETIRGLLELPKSPKSRAWDRVVINWRCSGSVATTSARAGR